MGNSIHTIFPFGVFIVVKFDTIITILNID